MRLLLDSHALLWWLLDAPQLPQSARDEINSSQGDVLISAVSVYELHYKAQRGHLLVDNDPLAVSVAESGFEPLPVTLAHAQQAARLDWLHRDPWDRILAAQALIEDCALLSIDKVFDDVRVRRIW